MLKMKLFSAILLSMLLGGVAFNAAAQQDLKVGYVDVARVYDGSPQKAEAQKKYTDEFTAKQEELKKLQAEVNALHEKYNRDAMTMSVDERAQFEEKVLGKERELKWNASIYEDDRKRREAEIRARIQQSIGKAIQKIGQDGKFDLILTDGVYFKSSRMDLSDEVLDLLKKGAVK